MIPDVNENREWLALVKEQEQALSFDSFSQNDAIQFVQNCIQLANSQYKKSVAAGVFLDNTLTALAMMDGTNLHNQLSLVAKRNVSAKTGESSMMTFLKIRFGLTDQEAWATESGNTMVCGGCFPIVIQGTICGFAAVSNMTHEEDHQLCADALAMIMNAKIASILT